MLGLEMCVAPATSRVFLCHCVPACPHHCAADGFSLYMWQGITRVCRTPYASEDALEPLLSGSLSSLVLKMTLMPSSVGLSDITLVCLRMKAVLGGLEVFWCLC